jgi:hypothetical protein
MFPILGYVGHRFEGTLADLALEWSVNGTVSNDLVLHFQELFLGLWHAHRNGVLIGNINSQNIGQTPDGKAVFCDLGHGLCDAPKQGYAFGKQSGPIGLSQRNSTVYYAAGSNPQGDANYIWRRGKPRGRLLFCS